MAICEDDEKRRVLYLWGNGANYQLGNGRRDNVYTPYLEDLAKDPETKIRVEFQFVAGGN